MTPVFTYYMIYQSLPGGGGSEQSAVLANLNNTVDDAGVLGRSQAVLPAGRRLPEHAVVLHVEPDMWGYVQQAASNDNAATFPRRSARPASRSWPGCRTTSPGMAQGIVRLRNQYAPNVILGYHVSVWGTGTDISMSDPSDSQVDALGNRAGAFYNSLGASFDVAFGEFSRPRLGVHSSRPAQGAAILVEQRRLPPPRAIHRPVRGHQRQADGDVADPARQHEDAGDEQHEAPLPGQPRRVAAGRAGAAPI